MGGVYVAGATTRSNIRPKLLASLGLSLFARLPACYPAGRVRAGMPARRWQGQSATAMVLSRRYMLEKTFMITPPEMISAIARMAGRSGFCL